MIGPDSRQYKTAPLPKEDHKDVSTSKAAPVQVLCTERSMIVIIRADLHSNGRRVTAKELRLGRSTESCKAFQYSDTEYVIEADLHQCGSELSVRTKEKVVLLKLLSVDYNALDLKFCSG